MTKGGNFHKKTLRDAPLRGKTVLLRADYNVPLRDDGTIADDFRIRASLPTLRLLLEWNCTVIIISHLGRPDGKRVEKYSLEPVADRLAALLKRPVRFVDDCIGDRARMASKRAPKGSVTVLENLRFHEEEETNDVQFAEALAKVSGAHYFVQDGFGVVHRAHASTAAIAQYLPSVAGLLLEKEYVTITQAMRAPERPLVAVLGGAKVSDKAPIIEALVPVADRIVIGGAMANTFLAHRGYDMGESMVEPDMGETIKSIYQAIERKNGDIPADDFLILPVDLGVGSSLEPTATRTDVPANGVAPKKRALDIGPKSVARMLEQIDQAKTVIWNGTLGYAEAPAFAEASAALAKALAGRPDVTSIIGGGDTADFVIHWDKRRGESFTHVSTGGGASLELMAGKKLPGIEQLLDA